MKNIFKRFAAVVVALVLVIALALADETSAASKNIQNLTEGATYSINLNGGSSKETVRWTNSGTGSSNTFNLYVNGKKVYSKHYSHGWISQVSCIDINRNDKYKEIVVGVNEDSNCYVDFFALRYINKNTAKRYSYSGDKLLRTPSASSKASSNKLFIRTDTPYFCYSFGCYYSLMPLRLSGGKLKRIKEKTYEIDSSWVNSYGSSGWSSNFFTLAQSMKLYSKGSKKAAYTTLYAGTKFKPLKISPRNISSKSGYKYADLFIKVKTTNGRTGWLYFPKNGSGYLKQTTGWG